MIRPVFLAASLLAVLFAVAPVTVAFAADPAAAASMSAADQKASEAFVQTLGDRAIGVIASKQLTADQRASAFSKILSESFDLKTIGRFVIGRSWNSATPEQQQEYTDLFKALVIKTYGSRMTLYTGEGFKVVGSHPESEMDTTVNSQITHPDGSQPTTIDWRVRDKDGKKGVIDVIVEGVSLSVTQRQEYASIIQRSGGQIDGLLKVMRDELNAQPVAAAK